MGAVFRLGAWLATAAVLAACGGGEAPETDAAETPPEEIGRTVDAVVTGPIAHSDEDDDHHDDDHDHDEDDSHGGAAHVHGRGDLAVAFGDDGIDVALLSPLYNLAGFEGAPDTPEKVAAYEEMGALLEAPADLFAFDEAAGCAPSSALFPVVSGETADETETFDYVDLEAQFAFECADVDAVTEMRVGLFDAFPRFEEIDVVILEGGQQAALEIDPTETVVALR